MTKDETLLYKRFVDLSRQAQQRDRAVFSDFLNLNEQNIFHQSVSALYCGYELSGGHELSERQMIAFLPDALCYTYQFPICCLRILNKSGKFADALTHQDVLGSLMHLGIQRSMLGDILVEDRQIYLFCQEKIAAFLTEELTRIRHANVQAEIADPSIVSIVPRVQELSGIISSNRLDSVIACICKSSRSQASEWIRGGKVFLNGKEILQPARECKEGELISIRSVGRFRFQSASGETKKGRLKINYEKYI